MIDWQPPKFGEKQPNEVECYTVGIGNFSPNPFLQKKQKEVLDFIQKLDGFCGVYPYYPKGTLCIFKTENNAKIAQNKMDAKGIQTGKIIGKIFVDKQYVERG